MASPTWLTRTADLDAVRREGKRYRTRLLEVRSVASLHHAPRVGIIVPRYQQSAVARNRLKRRLRELVRREWLRDQVRGDLVLRAAPSAYDAAFDELRDAVAAYVIRQPTPDA